jgi:hypothetical protein
MVTCCRLPGPAAGIFGPGPDDVTMRCGSRAGLGAFGPARKVPGPDAPPANTALAGAGEAGRVTSPCRSPPQTSGNGTAAGGFGTSGGERGENSTMKARLTLMPSPHPVAERLRALASGSALAAIGCFSAAEPLRWGRHAGLPSGHQLGGEGERRRERPARVSLEGTVPLSEHERRQPEQIEAALREGDPRFQTRYAQPTRGCITGAGSSGQRWGFWPVSGCCSLGSLSRSS